MFDVRDKKITVMGLGLLGRGIGDVKFLVSQGAKVTVTDLKTREQLKSSVFELEKFYKAESSPRLSRKAGQGKQKAVYKIKYVLGRHRAEDFQNADFILKAAGVPLNSSYIKVAQKNKIPIKMDDSWLAEFAPCPIIGVTGTRGKTTTVTLIYEILKANTKKGERVYLGGNIRGMATLPLIKKLGPKDKLVLELSSWQLQGWAEAKVSPHIALITNIYPDHLNYYGTMGNYITDKKTIYRNQSKNDRLILNKKKSYSREFSREARSKVIWFSIKDVPKNWRVKILGEHNLANIAAAIKVAGIFKISKAKVKKVIESFRPVEGRLEFMRNYKGAKIYNDNNATTPEAVIAALNSFREPIVLLAGGSKKQVSYKVLAGLIKKKVKALILFRGKGSDDLRKDLKKIKYNQPLVIVQSMKEAIGVAKKLLERGDVFLFSPAAASFGLFINEYDRNDQFKKLVRSL
jgi:UDP-N-acetylmuramoylalanine--D-glutamate ligase